MDFLLLVIFLLGCAVIVGLIFLLSNGKSHRPPTYGDGYTCGSKGCVKVKNGDYPSEDVCVLAVVSGATALGQVFFLLFSVAPTTHGGFSKS